MIRRGGVCFASAVLAGAGAAMLGPLLPVLSREWQLTDAAAGVLPACEFAGGFCGAIASGWLGAKRDLGSLLAAGLGLLALGLGGAALVSRIWMAPFLFVCGVGLGFINPTANLIVSRFDSPAAALNLFGFWWAAGALAAPSVIALALQAHGPSWVFAMLAVCAAAVGSGAAALGRERASAVPAMDSPIGAIVVFTAVSLFLYVGVETSISLWLPLCAVRWAAAGEAKGAAVQSAFWSMLLLGRLFAPAWLRYLTARALVLSGILTAVAGIGLLLAADGYVSVLAGALLTGFGLAPVNPTILAIFTGRLGPAAGRWTGPVFASSGLGGAAIPWMVGAASSALGGLRSGIAVALVCALAMLGTAQALGAAPEARIG